MKITEKEHLQDEEYDFPYHHLVQIRPFSEVRHLFWGFRYGSYVEKILEILKNKKFDSLVDIGCGDGKITREVYRAFPDKDITGIDYSEKSLRFTRAFSSEITFQTHTEKQYDAFTLVEVLEHINPESMDDFLTSLSNNLKPGGFGIITTPSDNIPLNPKHYQHFNRTSAEKTLGGIFAIEAIEYISANSLYARTVQHLLANRFFILNYKPLVDWLYESYKSHCLNATKENVFATVHYCAKEIRYARPC